MYTRSTGDRPNVLSSKLHFNPMQQVCVRSFFILKKGFHVMNNYSQELCPRNVYIMSSLQHKQHQPQNISQSKKSSRLTAFKQISSHLEHREQKKDKLSSAAEGVKEGLGEQVSSLRSPMGLSQDIVAGRGCSCTIYFNCTRGILGGRVGGGTEAPGWSHR